MLLPSLLGDGSGSAGSDCLAVRRRRQYWQLLPCCAAAATVLAVTAWLRRWRHYWQVLLGCDTAQTKCCLCLAVKKINTAIPRPSADRACLWNSTDQNCHSNPATRPKTGLGAGCCEDFDHRNSATRLGQGMAVGLVYAHSSANVPRTFREQAANVLMVGLIILLA